LIPGISRNVSLLHRVQINYDAHEAPIQCLPGALNPRAKRTGREADYSLPSSAQVKNVGSIPTLSIFLHGEVKVKLPLYRSWRLLGLQEVEAPTFFSHSLTDGGKVVTALKACIFLPQEKFLVLIFVKG
jgi:hypothetical protein